MTADEHHASNGTVDCSEIDSNLGLQIFHWMNFVIILIVAIIGLVSQIIVLIVLKSIRKKSSTDIFLIGLSVCDLCLILCLMISENAYIYSHILTPGIQIYNAGFMAVILHPLEHIAHFCTTWVIVLMSVDRYMSVCHAIRSRDWCTPNKAKLQLIILPIVAVIFAAPRFVEYYTLFPHLDEVIAPCEGEVHEYPEETIGANPVYIWLYTFTLYMIAMYVIPLGTLCFTNYHLTKAIKKRNKFHEKIKAENPSIVQRSTADVSDAKRVSFIEPTKSRDMTPVHADNNSVSCVEAHTNGSAHPPVTMKSSGDKSMKKQYDQVIRMLVTVTIVFCVCQIPDMIVQIMSRLFPGQSGTEELEVIAFDFIVINCSINLFIYTATSRRFKAQLFKYLNFIKSNQIQPFPDTTIVEENSRTAQ